MSRVYKVAVTDPDGKSIAREILAKDIAANPDPAEALKVAAILAIDDLLEDEVPGSFDPTIG